MNCIVVISSVLRTYLLFFFFSSRRRHTRCLSDWSSDVCSSDLVDLVLAVAAFLDLVGGPDRPFVERLRGLVDMRPLELGLGQGAAGGGEGDEIGRASCRERV